MGISLCGYQRFHNVEGTPHEIKHRFLKRQFVTWFKFDDLRVETKPSYEPLPVALKKLYKKGRHTSRAQTAKWTPASSETP